jgi:hypothetical protein
MNSLVYINDCETQKNEDPAEFTPEIRIDKVLSVRRQLGEGRYYAAGKLDMAVDRLLEVLLNH